MNIKKVRLWIFGSLVFLYSLGTGFAFVLPAYQMSSEGVACQATMLRLRDEKPETFDYEYMVNGVTYENVGLVSRFPGAQPGAKITVHYLPHQPTTCYAGDTAKRLEDYTFPAVLASIIIPLLLSYIIPKHFGHK